MDLLTRPAPSPRSLRPRISDPQLRAQLPAAVLARPELDAVPSRVWQQVARCLEATGHAAACADEGCSPSATAVLVSLAVVETAQAQSLLGRRLPGAVRTAPRRDGSVPVERTWFRLAGLLAGPVPADAQVLAAVLADHQVALAEWQRVLLGPAGLPTWQARSA